MQNPKHGELKEQQSQDQSKDNGEDTTSADDLPSKQLELDPDHTADVEAGILNIPAVVTEDVAIQHSIELSRTESAPKWAVFGRREKKGIVMIASLGAFFSPLTTNIYFPALNEIAKDLNVSINEVNLSITTYMVSPLVQAVSNQN